MTSAGPIAATPELAGLSTDGLAAVDAFIQQQIDAGTIPGAVTLVARHGKVVHANAMGKKDIASGAPSETDGIYRIFSMTKPITGTAMMILHDAGLWSPDDPIAKHLPELANVQVLTDDGTLVAPDHLPTMEPVGKGTYHWDGAAGTRFWVDPENNLCSSG